MSKDLPPAGCASDKTRPPFHNDYMELMLRIEREDPKMFSNFAPALRSSVAIYKEQIRVHGLNN